MIPAGWCGRGPRVGRSGLVGVWRSVVLPGWMMRYESKVDRGVLLGWLWTHPRYDLLLEVFAVRVLGDAVCPGLRLGTSYTKSEGMRLVEDWWEDGSRRGLVNEFVSGVGKVGVA